LRTLFVGSFSSLSLLACIFNYPYTDAPSLALLLSLKFGSSFEVWPFDAFSWSFSINTTPGRIAPTNKHYGGATRPLPRDVGVKEFHEDQTVRPRPKVWTSGQKWKK